MSRCTFLFLVTLLVASASFSVALSAQGVTRTQAPIEPFQRSNSIFFELAGSGGLWSLNYERLMAENFGVRIGASLQAAMDKGQDIVFVPATFNYFLTASDDGVMRPSKLELGGGVVLLKNLSLISIRVIETATLAYRYQPSDGGYLFRVAFTPFLEAGRFETWGGISGGLTF